jgi:hypothetical protein
MGYIMMLLKLHRLVFTKSNEKIFANSKSVRKWLRPILSYYPEHLHRDTGGTLVRTADNLAKI